MNILAILTLFVAV
ncbi:hypothetical protein CbuG_0737 [Coxiella burnetii CbuG_Q212]|nr:hypothetical protein CbuG_0737 [Coxiella burnetii CbuG_Q212]